MSERDIIINTWKPNSSFHFVIFFFFIFPLSARAKGRGRKVALPFKHPDCALYSPIIITIIIIIITSPSPCGAARESFERWNIRGGRLHISRENEIT